MIDETNRNVRDENQDITGVSIRRPRKNSPLPGATLLA
jgi:hypothetical protein